MTVNVHEAKTRLSQLIERAEAGEDVIIARAGKPVVRLAIVNAEPFRRLGAARGMVREGLVGEQAGWEKAMTDEEADEFLGL